MNEYIKKSEAVDVIVKYPYDIAGKTATAIKMIEDLPSADVVPKSEVEKIFAEIEKEIDTGLSVIEKILNTKGGRANGETVLISKYDVYREAKKYIAELKKKYTEGEE